METPHRGGGRYDEESKKVHRAPDSEASLGKEAMDARSANTGLRLERDFGSLLLSWRRRRTYRWVDRRVCSALSTPKTRNTKSVEKLGQHKRCLLSKVLSGPCSRTQRLTQHPMSCESCVSIRNRAFPVLPDSLNPTYCHWLRSLTPSSRIQAHLGGGVQGHEDTTQG